MIEADIDRYGSLIRPSSLADYLEISAAKSAPCSFAHIQDMVRDRWPRLREKYSQPEDLYSVELTDQDSFYNDLGEDFSEIIDQVRSVIAERAHTLKDRYPFLVHDHGITIKKDFIQTDSPYLVLLALSIGHAYQLNGVPNLTQALEDIVVESFDQSGLIAHNVAKMSRESTGGFTGLITALSEATKIPMSTSTTSYRTHAQDGGVDILAHFPQIDTRRGRWILLGQITCAKSDGWLSKYSEVETNRWQNFMGESVAPLKFLAVPYHVNDRAWKNFTDGSVVMIFDRLRLTLMLPETMVSGADIVPSVMQAPIESMLA